LLANAESQISLHVAPFFSFASGSQLQRHLAVLGRFLESGFQERSLENVGRQDRFEASPGIADLDHAGSGFVINPFVEAVNDEFLLGDLYYHPVPLVFILY
jgi:hypothetical protein